MASTKAIQNSIKKIAKNKEQYNKQTKRKFANAIKKAERLLDETDSVVAELSRNIQTKKTYNTAKVKAELEKMKTRLEKKGSLTYTQFVRLKDLSSKRWYGNNVMMWMDTPDSKRYFGTDVVITKSEWIKLSEAERISRKDYRISTGETDKELTTKEQEIFKQYSKAFNVIANIQNSIDFSDEIAIPETEAGVIKLLKQQRGTSQLDLSFGGHSALLNDLSYSANAKGNIGRDFVTWIRGLMEKDKVIFAKIEKWYQSPAAKEARKAINNAVGDEWYENFKEFSLMVEKVMNELQIELNLGPDEFSESIMNEAEQRIAGYADGYAT